MDIDSDSAVREALECFVDEYNGVKRKEYLTLHAEDCLNPSTSGSSTTPVCVGQKV